MTEKQERLFQLFRELDEICREHGLRYVLAGGTAIGAVRNQGFIPWDDDVDIYMPRDDWERLAELARTELPENRTLLCVDIDRSYTNTFPRYGSTDSCALHKHQIIGKDTAGEIIDVLTLDPIPADDKEYEKYRTHMMIYSELVNLAVVFGARWEIPLGMYLRYLLSYVFLGRDRTLKKLERIMFSYKEEDCPRYAMRWGGCPFLFDKDMMFPAKPMIFEGQEAFVPHRMSDYLIWHYGDEWSYIPPHGERESHDAITLDGISYQELREDYLPHIKKGRLRRESVFRKVYGLASARRTHRIQRKRDLLKAKSTTLDLQARIRESKKPLKTLVEERDFRRLNRIFQNYFQVQLSAGFIGREDFSGIYMFYHPILLEVEEETFFAAMMTLLYTERVGKASRMLQVKEQADGLSPRLEQLKRDILLFRKGVGHYEFGEKEAGEAIADELLDRYPENPGFLKFKLRFLMERARQGQDEEETEAFLGKALELLGEDGYFLKYQGELLWNRGRCADALELFARARESTRNGIIHLELDQFLEPYKEQTAATCQALLDNRQRADALRLMELWSRLLPKDDLIREYHCLARACGARTRREMEELVCEMKAEAERLLDSPEKKEQKRALLYRRALVRAWERLGYPRESAELLGEIFYTRDTQELEWIAEKARGSLIYHKDQQAEIYKVMGDARRKQGQTRQAFLCYRTAMAQEGRSYGKTEASRILLEDLYSGSKKAAAYAKAGDAMDYLDGWLGKYGELQELLELVKRMA